MPGATTAVLLVNLGTPRSPSPRDVRRYLREFLGEPRVLDMPALARFLPLARERGIGVHDGTSRAGLHAHRRDVVRDHVVQFAGDAHPVEGDGLRGRDFALVGGHADRAAIRSKALADELAEIQFADVGHARGARIAEV